MQYAKSLERYVLHKSDWHVWVCLISLSRLRRLPCDLWPPAQCEGRAKGQRSSEFPEHRDAHSLSPLSFPVWNICSCCHFSSPVTRCLSCVNPWKHFWDACFHRVRLSCFHPVLFLHVSVVSTGYHPLYSSRGSLVQGMLQLDWRLVSNGSRPLHTHTHTLTQGAL